MRDHLAYLSYVLRHKWYVIKAAKKVDLPLWRAILHDWTKFLPSEWFPYVKNFYRSDGSRRPKSEVTTWIKVPFDESWNAHQKRNKHHWQYWILTQDSGETEYMPIPHMYIREMVADWVGAGLAISGKGNASAWYIKNKDKIELNSNSRAAVEALLFPLTRSYADKVAHISAAVK